MGRIITRHDGAKFHLGGRKVPRKEHALKLHDPRFGLNLAAWPDAPDRTNYGQAPAALACLSDILGNDQLGCCTEADQYHRQALRQAAGGNPVYHPPVGVVIGTYSRDGGYVVGQPATDQGCDEVTVLTNQQQQGIQCDAAGTMNKSSGFILVDATNRDLVRKVVSACVGANICMGLPDDWVNPFPSSPGWTWDVTAGGTDPNNGHAFTGADQTSGQYFECWSWGMPFYLTWEALAAYGTTAGGGGLYVELDQDMINAMTQMAPDALDWATLQQVFAAQLAAP